jgi:hypothetical protein
VQRGCHGEGELPGDPYHKAKVAPWYQARVGRSGEQTRSPSEKERRQPSVAHFVNELELITLRIRELLCLIIPLDRDLAVKAPVLR